MRMGQDDAVQARDVHRERLPVHLSQILVALEETAINQNLTPGMLQQVFGAGHRASGTEKCQLHVLPFDCSEWLTLSLSSNCLRRSYSSGLISLLPKYIEILPLLKMP